MIRRCVLIVASLGFGSLALAGQPAGLELSDLAAYRAAIDGKPKGAATPATFRQLWEHPEIYQGKRVRVEGRVARRFQQGAYGTFPPLVEAWAVTPSGDPFCLVYPATGSEVSKSSNDAAPGALIRFEGVFLRALEYQGSDAKRLAPLIVGDRTPVVVAPPKVSPKTPAGMSTVDWALGLGAAALVALVLARQHFRAPGRASLRKNLDLEPPPEFVDSA